MVLSAPGQQNFSYKTSFDVLGQYTLGQTNLINNRGFLFKKNCSNTVLQLIYTFKFTVTHTLGFSVFTNGIMAMDFNTVIMPVSQNYIPQIPHVKSSQADFQI
jgi:hypothetical protein